MELSDIKGLKAKRIEKLKSVGITSPTDLILQFPFNYLDVTAPIDFVDGESVAFLATLTAPAVRRFIRRGLNLVKGKFKTSYGQIVEAAWFNRPYVYNQLVIDKPIVLSGKVKKINSRIEISAPTLYNYDDSSNTIIPLYKPISGLPINVQKEAIKTILSSIKIDGYIDKKTAQEFELLPLDTAIRVLHFPQSIKYAKTAGQSVAIENLSHTISVYNILKLRDEGKRAFKYNDNRQKLDNFIKKLPFELTIDQNEAIDDIISSFHSPQKLNRLIQGDVGCGKTIVAFLAMYYAYLSGHQSVMMAPTEILARQHFLNATKLFEKLGIKIEFLTKSKSKTARDTSLFNIKNGMADFVIGTHALINADVDFFDLSLVITDEQQRFGVAQRGSLENKSLGADTIVMSATPIPRTLALTLYGDLEQSIIKTMPKGKAKVNTRFVPKERVDDMYAYIKTCAEKDLQTYIVCPRVEDEEDGLTSVEALFKELSKKFQDVKIALLHGQMKEKEKSEIMSDFADGKTKILVATTVVEVGLDVKNAVNMVILNPERYGLSQLHQLRGRVGRGEIDGYCFLLCDKLQSEAKERLDYFVSTPNGFSLAEYDFSVRGAGDFLGLRQHGQASAFLGTAITPTLLETAKKVSDTILSNSSIREEIIKNLDENRTEYIKSLALN